MEETKGEQDLNQAASAIQTAFMQQMVLRKEQMNLEMMREYAERAYSINKGLTNFRSTEEIPATDSH